MTNRIVAALPVGDIPQTRNVEPIPIESRTAEEDSVGALRVGIVGVGEQTTSHLLPALLTMPEVRITALVDPLRERRDALADRIGVSAGFDSVAQLLADGEVDAILAACPPQAHEQIAAAAIAARVPVFVEKPPATTTTALTQLAAAAAEAGVVTGVGMNFRWAAPVRRLTARLLPGPGLDKPHGADEHSVTTPLWIVEQQVPAERREPEPHVHVDHLYLALTEATVPPPEAELPFTWYTADQLDALDMFNDTRARTAYLLDRIDTLTEAPVYDRVPG